MKIRSENLTPNLTPLTETTQDTTVTEDAVSVPEKPVEVVAVRRLPHVAGYDPLVFTYIGVTDYGIAPTLQEALKLRKEGKRVLSMREADILARGDVALNKGSMFDGVMMDKETGFLLCEGTPGCDNSGWHLRFRYNKGVEWINERVARRRHCQARGDTDSERKLDYALNEGRAALDAIRTELNGLLLYLWPGEIDYGFKPFLLKPEFMTVSEYSKIVSSKIEIDVDELNEMLEGLGAI